MVVRLATLLAGLALLAGCSTEEGLRARELLQQAEAAQAQLRSSTFDGGMTIDVDGMRVALTFDGATSPEGEWLRLRASGTPGSPRLSMQVLNRNGRVSMNMGDGWRTYPAGAAPPGADGTMSAEAFRQLARYVRDVRVAEHQLVGGKPKATIAGEIDTQGMLQAATRLGSLAPEGLDLADAGVGFGDVHAVLTIDEATHLLDAALVSFSIEAEGKQAKVELRYRLASANRPVELPQP